jgi:RNA polymerase sigma-70 factor, ECF subfamily
MTRARVQPDPGLALLELYDTALPEIYGYLLVRCGRHGLAEDLTAETFLAAVQACRRDPGTPLSTAWLVGVARHKLVDHWRTADREDRGLRALDGLAGGPSGSQPDPAEAHVDALLARQTLAALRPAHRAALTLRYLDGLAVPEVAEHLGRSVHATEALLARARTAFRRAYAPTPDEEGR